MSLSRRLREAKTWTVNLAHRTKIEIVLGASLGALAFGLGSNQQQIKKSEFQYVGYAEFSQLEDANKSGIQATNKKSLYYAATNDFIGKVFEAYNGESILEAPANALGSTRSWLFAYNLEQATDTNRAHRRNITDFSKLIPQLGREALTELADLRSASATGTHLANRASQVWDYAFDRDGHLESDVSCSTDEDGDRSCTTTWHYECDKEYYTWKFKPQQGLLLEQALQETRTRLPRITRDPIVVANNTQTPNDEVIRSSFMRMYEREPTPTEILAWSHKYSTGSQHEQHIVRAVNLWSSIINTEVDVWTVLQKTARTISDTTDCTTPPEPAGYTFTSSLPNKLAALAAQERAITEPITRTIRSVPYLMSLINERVARTSAVIEKVPSNNQELAGIPTDKLEHMIIDSARAMYRDNFPGGLPTTEYNGTTVFLMTLLGTAVGASIGLGTDYAINKIAGSRNNKYS